MALRRWSLDDKRRVVVLFESGGIGAVTGAFGLKTATAQNYVAQFRADIRRYEERQAHFGATEDAQAAVPASRAPNLERVPATAEGLPWVSYPRDAASQNDLAKILEDTRAVAAEHGANDAVLKSLDSQIAHVRALIARSAVPA